MLSSKTIYTDEQIDALLGDIPENDFFQDLEQESLIEREIDTINMGLDKRLDKPILKEVYRKLLKNLDEENLFNKQTETEFDRKLIVHAIVTGLLKRNYQEQLLKDLKYLWWKSHTKNPNSVIAENLIELITRIEKNLF